MIKSPKNKPDISIIVLNYNAKDYLTNCLHSFIKSNLNKYQAELIVVDNSSTDDSFAAAQKIKSTNPHLTLKFIKLSQNIGFSAGNNRGVAQSSPTSRYVLFVNPDTVIEPSTLAGMIGYLDKHSEISAATCYVNLVKTGQLQPECHRGFPTPLNSFWHFFGFGLPKLFPRSQFFNGYFMGHLNYTKPQLIDCCVGAFFMIRRQIGDQLSWWNEKYFMYGEDLDFCYRLRQQHFQLYFVPFWKIDHYQGVSSGLTLSSTSKTTSSTATRLTRIRSALATTASMRIFYQDNLIKKYSPFWQWFVWRGIGLLEYYRLFKAKYL